ncbi:hypothetical protein SDC9_59550 [bioreactor metagenome]|uniref:Uncharacterized protein n=1 Tax=bioreactor metagenome TaxID=1076179 RepID=A0A644XAE3_9ZZZZ
MIEFIAGIGNSDDMVRVAFTDVPGLICPYVGQIILTCDIRIIGYVK